MRKELDLTAIGLWIALLALCLVSGSQRIATQLDNSLEHPAIPRSPTAPVPF